MSFISHPTSDKKRI